MQVNVACKGCGSEITLTVEYVKYTYTNTLGMSVNGGYWQTETLPACSCGYEHTEEEQMEMEENAEIQATATALAEYGEEYWNRDRASRGEYASDVDGWDD